MTSNGVLFQRNEISDFIEKALEFDNIDIAVYLFEQHEPFRILTFKTQLYFACDFGQVEKARLLMTYCLEPESMFDCCILSNGFRIACLHGNIDTVEFFMLHTWFRNISLANHDFTFFKTCSFLHLDIAKRLYKDIPITIKVVQKVLLFMQNAIFPIGDRDKYTQMIDWLQSINLKELSVKLIENENHS